MRQRSRRPVRRAWETTTATTPQEHDATADRRPARHPTRLRTGRAREPDARPRAKLLDLSLTQLLGGSMAAATAAALGSRLGVVGTIAGAAVLSVVSAIAATSTRPPWPAPRTPSCSCARAGCRRRPGGGRARALVAPCRPHDDSSGPRDDRGGLRRRGGLPHRPAARHRRPGDRDEPRWPHASAGAVVGATRRQTGAAGQRAPPPRAGSTPSPSATTPATQADHGTPAPRPLLRRRQARPRRPPRGRRAPHLP